MLTSRRRRPLVREAANRDARLIVIATEGEHTERIYFNAFNSRNVQIVPLATEDCKSSPAAVADRIEAYKSEFQIGEGDEFWIVVDRDAWHEGTLSQIASECTKDETKWFALSNPCFEIWLAFHFTDDIPPTLKSTEAEGFLRSLFAGFKKSAFDAKKLLPLVDDAIRRAKDRSVEGERWPNTIGSDVYLLMESIRRR